MTAVGVQSAKWRSELASIVTRTKRCTKVILSEPKGAPGAGVTAGVWVASCLPAPGLSGYRRTGVHLLLRVRLYMNAIEEPVDRVDTTLADAMDDILAAAITHLIPADGEETDDDRTIDVHGKYGPPFGGTFGYQNIDGKWFRVVDINAGLLLGNVWP